MRRKNVSHAKSVHMQSPAEITSVKIRTGINNWSVCNFLLANNFIYSYDSGDLFEHFIRFCFVFFFEISIMFSLLNLCISRTFIKKLCILKICQVTYAKPCSGVNSGMRGMHQTEFIVSIEVCANFFKIGRDLGWKSDPNATPVQTCDVSLTQWTCLSTWHFSHFSFNNFQFVSNFIKLSKCMCTSVK